MVNIYEEYIPIPSGQMGMVVKQRLMSDLLGQTGYEVRGKEIIFTRDLTALSPKVNGVDMWLVVMDMSRYSEYEILPITADLEAQVVDTVYKMFAGEQARPQTIDSTADTK